MMSDAVNNSKKCQELDTTEQCGCWANQTILIKKIKDFDCLAKSTQKNVTKHKVIFHLHNYKSTELTAPERLYRRVQ